MALLSRGALAALLAVCAFGFDVRPAHAAGDIYLRTTGPAASEVTLSIADPTGAPIPAARDEDGRPGITHVRNLPPGTYKVTVTRGDQRREQDLVVRDNQVNSYDVDSTTLMLIAAPVPPQQQRQRGQYSIGLLGGVKRTPFDGEVTSAALASRDSGDLDETIGNVGFEGRYYFGNRMQQLGAQMFIVGTYIHYMGGPLARLFGDRHPTNGNDVGASVEERDSFMFGIGGDLNVLQRAGIGLMLGLHATRVEGAAIGDESGGGGIRNVFRNRETLIGAYMAAEAFYTLGWLQGMGPVQAGVRTTLKWMPDIEVRGTSNLGFDYKATIDGGLQVEGNVGLRFLF